MSNSAARIINLITDVVSDARRTSIMETVDLHTVRGLCLERAKDNHPDLVPFLSAVRGLVGVSVTMSQLPHLVSANDDRGTAWTFVRTRQ